MNEILCKSKSGGLCEGRSGTYLSPRPSPDVNSAAPDTSTASIHALTLVDAVIEHAKNQVPKRKKY